MSKRSKRPRPGAVTSSRETSLETEARRLLATLENLYERVRTKMPVLYPYDERSKKISLPPDIEAELRRLMATGKLDDRVEALKRVTHLTGAGLRISKDYVDGLAAGSNKRR